MPTAEKLKNSLASCADGTCRDCSYELECSESGCFSVKMMQDAITYIGQLEQENTRLKEELKKTDEISDR